MEVSIDIKSTLLSKTVTIFVCGCIDLKSQAAVKSWRLPFITEPNLMFSLGSAHLVRHALCLVLAQRHNRRRPLIHEHSETGESGQRPHRSRCHSCFYHAGREPDEAAGPGSLFLPEFHPDAACTVILLKCKPQIQLCLLCLSWPSVNTQRCHNVAITAGQYFNNNLFGQLQLHH